MRTIVKLLACFAALTLVMTANAEFEYEAVNNFCTNVPKVGTIDDALGRWDSRYSLMPNVKCAKLAMYKNQDGLTYAIRYVQYDQNDTDFSNPKNFSQIYMKNPDDCFEVEGFKKNGSLVQVVHMAVLKPKFGFGAVGCDIKDGAAIKLASVFAKPNADEADIEDMKTSLEKISKMTLNKVDQKDCPNIQI